MVDGTPVTEEDVTYALTIAHRREDLSGGGSLDIRSYIDKLVDDRLIMNEARSAGMDQYPEVRQAVAAYVLRESVVRLHKEEIVGRVSVTPQEAEEFYHKNYERFIMKIIDADSAEKAEKILGYLKEGADFEAVTEKYLSNPAENRGEVALTRLSLSPVLREAASGLKEGETSGSVKIGEKYYIVKLIRREKAAAEEFARMRRQVEKTLRGEKEQARSDEYLAYLRGKAEIKINQQLLAALNLNCSEEERKRLLTDERSLATVNGSDITVAEFSASFPRTSRKSKEQLVENWIDKKLVDGEALSRHYENLPEMRKKIERYENQLLKDIFIKKIILPQIVVSEKILEDYYTRHANAFVKPVCYKTRRITVKTREEAEEIAESLEDGADFGWIAKRKSVDPFAGKGGDAGCLTVREMPETARKFVDTLRPGDVSPVVEIDSLYGIFVMQGKEGGGVEEFAGVREAVYKACFAEQLDGLLEKYVGQLKTGARIRIYADEI
ncbi:MAG: peptidyl-prolyl cis-trans isomerase [Nitrospirota bacterium]